MRREQCRRRGRAPDPWGSWWDSRHPRAWTNHIILPVTIAIVWAQSPRKFSRVAGIEWPLARMTDSTRLGNAASARAPARTPAKEVGKRLEVWRQ